MMQRLLYILLGISLLASCSTNKVNKSEIINDDEFIEVLKDFHKSEGIISIAKLNNKTHKNDTISPYNYILKKHNVSRAKFDKTLKYYSNHTSEYIHLYDSINIFFSLKQKELEMQIEEDLKKMTPKQQFASKNLWPKKQEWVLKSIPKNNPFKFNLNTSFQGKYVLSANVFTSPNIPTIEKRVELLVNYQDGTSEKSHNILKTKWKNYKRLVATIVTNKNKKVKSISGNIITYIKGEKRHFHLKNIEIKYINKENRKIK